VNRAEILEYSPQTRPACLSGAGAYRGRSLQGQERIHRNVARPQSGHARRAKSQPERDTPSTRHAAPEASAGRTVTRHRQAEPSPDGSALLFFFFSVPVSLFSPFFARRKRTASRRLLTRCEVGAARRADHQRAAPVRKHGFPECHPHRLADRFAQRLGCLRPRAGSVRVSAAAAEAVVRVPSARKARVSRVSAANMGSHTRCLPGRWATYVPHVRAKGFRASAGQHPGFERT
jgi:hypothetical protein